MKRWIFPCWGIFLIFAAAASAAAQDAITDKTMVVWAAPANLTQRGGSALTVDMANPDAFDAIVFGEFAPQKWMAGSTLGKRTQRNQDAYAAETAGPDDFVQMAIVYQGRHVTIYRNGETYASYEMPEQSADVRQDGHDPDRPAAQSELAGLFRREDSGRPHLSRRRWTRRRSPR